MSDDYLTTAEAAEQEGMTPAQLNAWLGRHGVRRFVKASDIRLAKAASGDRHVRATQCAVKDKEHWWDPRTKEIDEPSGKTLVWCGRHGCGVGVVLLDDQKTTRNTAKTNGRVVYRHRQV